MHIIIKELKGLLETKTMMPEMIKHAEKGWKIKFLPESKANKNE